ncbi:hypothetical protein [Rhizobium sp. BK399]|uniref:hypothetical protein n=1 Tax=Rhizobium sp. BK399 TaxID=2587063 RepID=UPI00160AEB7E|nr:hypothetical protein [Rhizobium sp. BK399]MBB3545490.1 hypothetical protein [Rhizobium sp. BK399]
MRAFPARLELATVSLMVEPLIEQPPATPRVPTGTVLSDRRLLDVSESLATAKLLLDG